MFENVKPRKGCYKDQARSLDIPLSVLDSNPRLDLTVDDADKLDLDLKLGKGRDGAILRDKMVEATSEKFVVVFDDKKLVARLGDNELAMLVEVVQICWKYNLIRLRELFKEGCGKPYVTDNSNYIVGLYYNTPIKDALATGKEISALKGVVEPGLFLNMATSTIIATKNGVEVKNKWNCT